MTEARRILMVSRVGSLSGAGFVINIGWNGALHSAFINGVWAGIGICGLIAHRYASLSAISLDISNTRVIS